MEWTRRGYPFGELAITASCCLTAAAPGANPWVSYTDETSTRLVAQPSVGVLDPQEKDYAWGDVDHDNDVDLVVARKQPFTAGGGHRNILFVNETGVLTDRTADYITGFNDGTNDRDVALVDVDNDGWLDIVTAATCNGCNASGISDDSRLYMNLGAPLGAWLGYGGPTVLFGAGNNFTAVAAGDVTGDGYADLYFVSHQDTFEDQLMINKGAASPGAFTIENDRLAEEMRSSGFGTNAVIADMDNDGDKDIVKSQNGPVEIFRNGGGGFFDLVDPTYSGAAYNFGLGHLDGNGLLDIVISDDGIDRYIMNDGSLIDGSSDPALAFPNSTSGFNSSSVVADLDDDGHNDVLIADVDVDAPGCDRVAEVLRNNGDAPIPTFSADQGNIPTNLLTGVYDFAVFDINGDTLLDLVIGRCSGTRVLINSPCPWDLEGDRLVGINDFLDLLGAWGTDPGGPPDFDGDGDVGIGDFLALLGNWGPCP